MAAELGAAQESKPSPWKFATRDGSAGDRTGTAAAGESPSDSVSGGAAAAPVALRGVALRGVVLRGAVLAGAVLAGAVVDAAAPDGAALVIAAADLPSAVSRSAGLGGWIGGGGSFARARIV